MQQKTKITAKCFSYALVNKAAGFFQPFQMGVAIRGGLEAIVHTTRQVVEELQVQGDDVDDSLILRVDLINAFNQVDRDAAFKEVEDHFPEMLSWVLTCYKYQSILHFGSAVILRMAGWHQGDPLASLLFSLALPPIIKIIAQRVPELIINAWYLDDGGIVGKKTELQEVVDILLEHGPPRGLFLSTSATTNNNPKSSVWCPSAARAAHLGSDILDRGIPLVEDTGIVLLGSPIGSVEFERRVIGERMEKIREISSLLSLIEDPQTEYVLLRSCLSSPKFTFTLRTSNPSHHLGL